MSEINKMLSGLAKQRQVDSDNNKLAHSAPENTPLKAAHIKPVPQSRTPLWLLGGASTLALAIGLGWWLGSYQPQELATNTAAANGVVSGELRSEVDRGANGEQDKAAQTPVLVTKSSQAQASNKPSVTESSQHAKTPVMTAKAEPVKPLTQSAPEEKTTVSKPASTANTVQPKAAVAPVPKATQAVVAEPVKVARLQSSADLNDETQPEQSGTNESRVGKSHVEKSHDGSGLDESSFDELNNGEQSLTIEAVELSGQELAQIEFRRAMKAVKSGNSQKGIDYLTKAMKYQPDWVEARQKLSALYYGRGETRQAVATLQQGLARNSEQPGLRLTLAKLLVNESQPQAALSVLGKLPQGAPSDYLAMRGALAQQLKDNSRALESYQQLVKSEPYDGRWWLGLGIALERTQEMDKALQAYQQALVMGQISAKTQQFIQQRVAYLQSQES
ncbi:hypothetical protein A3K86_10085 [Photobacterium jeanii]|uniref:Uncharacterized protein n=1 Tax=Photobacterium jeanii TaxID=858640 RepID=A0A178KH13_9GAMM|nr:tetratricopeptide repeat protein [Photobacterium jeanii]OAN16511.1 hypothetical protein A3K86_10085 [Photobacterium jeanii]